jgi:hypothetical protein
MQALKSSNGRRTMTRLRGVSLFVLTGALGVDCGGDTATSPSTPPTTLFVLTAPVPLTPPTNATIPQNDQATGCTVQFPTVGYGHRIDFSWTAAQSSAGVDRYEVHSSKVGAPIPIVDTAVRGTSYSYVSCDSYVADINVDNWEWKVRAVDAGGAVGPWSAAVPFHFGVCRVGRSYCH